MTRFQKIIQILIAFVMISGLLAPTPTVMGKSKAADRVQPLLVEMAAASPDDWVRVIVQKSGELDRAEDLVTRLGGEVLNDLPLINAFAAELPVGQVTRLGSETSVRWVSLDAPMVAATSPDAAVFTTWAAEAGTTTPDTNTLAEDFKDTLIPAGRTIWFNSFIKVDHISSPASTVYFEDVSIEFTANGKTFNLPVPDAEVTISSSANMASTAFDAAASKWVSIAPEDYENKEVFLTGLAYQVPENLPPKIEDVTWSGHFSSDSPEVKGEWCWAAAVYSTFSTDYNALGVKPLKEDKDNPYLNNDPVGTPENFKVFLIPGGTGNGGDKYVGNFTSRADLYFRFHQAEGMTTATGPDGEYGFGSKVVGGFGGLVGEFTPGYDISKVEFVLQAYAPGSLDHDIKLTVSTNGQDKTKTLKSEAFDTHIGSNQAGLIYVDVTDAWDWSWTHFDADLEIFLNQGGLDPDEYVYYDAVGLRVTALPGTADEDVKFPKLPAYEPIDSGQLLNVYNDAVRAPQVWNEGPLYLQGQGVTVAVIDSGVGKTKDLDKRAFKHVNFNREFHDSQDRYGHGTFVASIVAADGSHSKGEYMGIAPKAFILNVRVSNDQGMGYESDIVDALQWLRKNKDAYNVRVVNLSLNSSVLQDYHDSPLCAAVEVLWFDGIVVVVSAGNNGTSELYPPANDPYVITVGATEDKGTASISDDTLASFSAYGLTSGGSPKPDLVAPGKDIITYLPNNDKLTMGENHPEKRVSDELFRMSGTSMAAPVVTGAVALLIQDEPNLTPDQVKYRLMSTARTDWAAYDPTRAGAGYLDIYAAVHGSSLEMANQGNVPHLLLAKMAMIAYWASQNGDENIDWNAVNWNAVNWNAVNWNAVNWNAVNWSAVNWNAVNWNAVNWNAVNWNAVNWNAVNWNAVNWNAVNWNAVNWNAVNWNSLIWNE